MPKKSLLIVSSQQFGYLTDTYKYCQYLEGKFEITYVCWDFGYPRLKLPKTKVIYISRSGNKVMRTFRLIRSVRYYLRYNFDRVFLTYFKGVSLVAFFVDRKISFFDVRTAAVCSGALRRKINDRLMKFESLFYSNVTVISDSIAKKLSLKNYFVLPLGGEKFKTISMTHDHIELIYVGTLQGRNMIEFIKGFHLFIKNKTFETEVRCTVIGDSPGKELEQLIKYSELNKLSNIYLTGWINHDLLFSYFSKSDIGISYVPITRWFDEQPPTKTFEYLVSGMPVLGTKTSANMSVINSENGILVGDSEHEIAMGLNEICSNFLLNKYDSKEIAKAASIFTWESIVNDCLIKILALE